MIGIYKITSPSGKVYIGQSWNIEKRWRSYQLSKKSHQLKLSNSINKYGWDSHIAEVAYELPIDVSQEVIDAMEILYISQYRQVGIESLNLREGGSRGRHSEESKTKMSKTNLAKPKEFFDRISKLGEKTRFLEGQLAWNKGLKSKPEWVQKMRASKIGEPAHNRGIPFSQESKDKMRQSSLGQVAWNKGLKLSENHRQKLSAAKCIKLICEVSGTIYCSISEAAIAINLSRCTLTKYLNGKIKNKTTLIYYDGR